MENIFAYTDAKGHAYPAYVSINALPDSLDGKSIKVSLREEGGGGTNPQTSQMFMPREQLQVMCEKVLAYLRQDGIGGA
jgi:tartrate dehydratase alpha subunit/fumarate hydratase class I-like protein